MQQSLVLAPGGAVAVEVVLACGVLGVAALAGPGPLVVAVAVAAAVLAWGWAGALGLPAPRSSAAVLALGGAVMVLAVADVGGSVPLIGVAVGVAVVAALVHQLLRRDGRPRLVESVASVTLGLGVLACGVAWVPVARESSGAVVATLAAVGVSAVVDLLGRWPGLRAWTVPVGMLAGAAAATGAAALLPEGPAYPTAVLLGVAGAAVSQAARAAFSVLPTLAHARPRMVSAVTSLLLTGAVGYGVLSVLH